MSKLAVQTHHAFINDNRYAAMLHGKLTSLGLQLWGIMILCVWGPPSPDCSYHPPPLSPSPLPFPTLPPFSLFLLILLSLPPPYPPPPSLVFLLLYSSPLHLLSAHLHYFCPAWDHGASSFLDMHPRTYFLSGILAIFLSDAFCMFVSLFEQHTVICINTFLRFDDLASPWGLSFCKFLHHSLDFLLGLDLFVCSILGALYMDL